MELARQLIGLARRAGARSVRVALVQANARLFIPGDDDHPCLVAFAFDRRIDDDQLQQVAERVSDLKGTHPIDPDLSAVSDYVTVERFLYYGRLRLPRAITGGPEVYLGQLFVHRPFLPDGYFSGEPMMTCLAVPGDRGALELLPPDDASAV